MVTFSVVQVPIANGRAWGVLRYDGRGGQVLLPSTYQTAAEAQQAAEWIATKSLGPDVTVTPLSE